MVFLISCGFLVFTNMIYIIWATGKTQWWNVPGAQQHHKTTENGSEEQIERQVENLEKTKEINGTK